MQVCIDYEAGWFLRINTKDNIRPCVAIPKNLHPFLDHDSHVECTLNEIDEFEIEDALNREGIIGRLDLSLAAEIHEAMQRTPYTSKRDKEQLAVLFAPFL